MAQPLPPGAFVFPHSIVAIAEVLGETIDAKPQTMQHLDGEVPTPGVAGDVADRIKQAVALLDANNKALEGWMAANEGTVVLVGTCDAGGNVSVVHGVDRLTHRVLAVTGWYLNSFSQAAPLTVNNVDDIAMSLSGGAAADNQPYRIFVRFSEQESGW